MKPFIRKKSYTLSEKLRFNLDGWLKFNNTEESGQKNAQWRTLIKTLLNLK